MPPPECAEKNGNTAEKLSDAELLAAFGKGNEKAFEVLYLRYRNLLYGYLNNLCGNNCCEADEVFEETWLRVIEKASKYRDDGKFSAWLFRISRNIFIDRIRRNKPELFVSQDTATILDDKFTEKSPASEAESIDINKMLKLALAELHPEQREVFLLREEEQLSFKEIAEIQGCPIGTVLSRMRYALKNLRAFLMNIDTGGLLK